MDIYKEIMIFHMESSLEEKQIFSKVMENSDIALIIFGYRRLKDNIDNSYITKNLFELSKCVIKFQLDIRRLFNRFKNRTVFPKKIYERNNNRRYNTLKNAYQNKEETPILTS